MLADPDGLATHADCDSSFFAAWYLGPEFIGF